MLLLSNNNITVTAGDDGICIWRLVIDSGTLHQSKNSTEGLEKNKSSLSSGDISIYSTDDGVNAANKNITEWNLLHYERRRSAVKSARDTDPIDSNGNITVTGGTFKWLVQTGWLFDGTTFDLHRWRYLSQRWKETKRTQSFYTWRQVDQMEALRRQSSPGGQDKESPTRKRRRVLWGRILLE